MLPVDDEAFSIKVDILLRCRLGREYIVICEANVHYKDAAQPCKEGKFERNMED